MAETKKDAKRYNSIRNWLALAQPVLLLAAFALIQASGLSGQISRISARLSPFRFVNVAVYAVLFGAVFYALTFYITFYRSFTLEHAFGLSTQSLADWLKDEAKRVLLSLFFFLIFAESLYAIIEYAPALWWLYLGVAWIAFSIIMTRVTPVLIMPLFYRFEKISDEDLRRRLLNLAGRCGVKILDVFRMKLSSKTKKANAALAGLGRTRRILLGDTLIDNYSKGEVEVVLAHELAHHKLRHISKMTMLGAVGILSVLYLSGLFLARLRAPGWHGQLGEPSSLPAILFAITLFSALAAPAENAFSRRLEKAADRYAIGLTSRPDAFISCMERLAEQNMSDPNPGRFVELALYNHPPISKRIQAARELANKGG